MSRRQRDDSDSFDLFLDTICNTFGGNVFLAILVALLAKVRSGTDSPDGPPPASPAAVRAAELKLQQITVNWSEPTLAKEVA